MSSGSGQRNGRAWRAAQRSALAALGVGLCSVALVALFPGCLNPRPDDYPSSTSDPGFNGDTPVEPVRETCADNPLLAECSPPAPGSGESSGTPSEESEDDPVSLGGDNAGREDAGTTSTSTETNEGIGNPDAGPPRTDGGLPP